MKIAITGPTGTIGRALVARWREHEIVALSRKDGVDLETPGPWCDRLDGCDAIVHLAGEPIAGRRWDARVKQLIRDSRVETTRTIVEAIGKLDRRPKVLVHASGVDYYPFASEFGEDDEVTEADPPAETFLGRVCRDWEREARAAEPLGVRVVAMRTGVVLPNPRLRGPFARIGDGRQWLSWIHIDDVVAAYTAALTDTRYSGPINLVTESTHNRDFFQGWLPVPAFAVRLAAGEFAEYLLEGRRVVPAKLRQLGFTWSVPSAPS